MKWSVDEIQQLRDTYPFHPNSELPPFPGRTKQSIVLKAHKLKLTKTKNVRKAIYGGANSPMWNPNKIWYKSILCTNHPFADTKGRVLEHRIVMEEWLRVNNPKHEALVQLGKKLYLSKQYIVHHLNGLRDDNRVCNLEVTKQKSHMQQHMTKLQEMADRNCEWCQTPFIVKWPSSRKRFCNGTCANNFAHHSKGHKINTEKEASIQSKKGKYPWSVKVFKVNK